MSEINYSKNLISEKVPQFENSESLKKNVILDFGCGDCKRWNHWLRNNGGNNTIGVDVDLSRIKTAKKRIQNGTQFLVCDGQHLPFKDFCFQHIHIDGVLHHIPNILKSLGEIKRTSCGTLYFGEAIDNYILFKISRRIIKRWRGKRIIWFFNSDQIRCEIEKEFTIAETNFKFSTLINNLLSYVGISNNRHYLGYFPLFDKLDYVLNYFLKKLGILKYFSTHIEILAINKTIPFGD